MNGHSPCTSSAHRVADLLLALDQLDRDGPLVAAVGSSGSEIGSDSMSQVECHHD